MEKDPRDPNARTPAPILSGLGSLRQTSFEVESKQTSSSGQTETFPLALRIRGLQQMNAGEVVIEMTHDEMRQLAEFLREVGS